MYVCVYVYIYIYIYIYLSVSVGFTRLVVRGVPQGAFARTLPSRLPYWPLWGGLVTGRVLFARAPVAGSYFFVSVNTPIPYVNTPLCLYRPPADQAALLSAWAHPKTKLPCLT